MSTMPLQSILERLGLEQYAKPLLDRGYDTPAKWKQLTDDVLIQAGINLSSSRRKLLTAIGGTSSGYSDVTIRHDEDENFYGNQFIAEMHHEERRASQASQASAASYHPADSDPPPPPCPGQVRRESIKGYIPMTKNRDSAGSSSNSNSPRASAANIHVDDEEDIYDCPPPPKAKFLPEEPPPMLPPKKNPSRKEKYGLPPSRPNSQRAPSRSSSLNAKSSSPLVPRSRSSTQVNYHPQPPPVQPLSPPGQSQSTPVTPVSTPPVQRADSDPAKRAPPVPKPRSSIKHKPVPAPRKKKNSIRIEGVTEESSEDGLLSTPIEAPHTEEKGTDEDIYEEMSEVSMLGSTEELDKNSSHASLAATSSSMESLDVSDLVPINWGEGGGGGDNKNTDKDKDKSVSVTKRKSKGPPPPPPPRDNLDVSVPPPPPTPRVQESQDDEYVPPDIGERPPSGGCDGQTHSPGPGQLKPRDDVFKPVDESKDKETDDHIMVDNDVYSRSSVHPQPEGRVVIGAELSAEEIENMANESAERVPPAPGRIGAYGGLIGVSSKSGDADAESMDPFRLSTPDDPSYGTIWDMKSGKQSGIAAETESRRSTHESIGSTDSTDSLSLLGDAPPPPSFHPPNPPVAPRAKSRVPTLDRPILFHSKSELDTFDKDTLDMPGSRDSTMSFNEPPPAFSPPPLPAHVVPSTPPELPFLPPRPSAAPKGGAGGSVRLRPKVLSPPINTGAAGPPPLPPPHCAPLKLPEGYLTTNTSQPAATSSSAVATTTDPPAIYSLVTKHQAHDVPPPKPLRAAPTPPTALTAPNFFAPVARQESEFDFSPEPTFSTRPGFGDFPGSEEDPFNLSSSSVDSSKGARPPPPPKVNAFESFYDTASGTYCLQAEDDDSMMDKEEPVPSATVWESDDYLSDGGDFVDDSTIKKYKNTLKKKQNPVTIIPARKSSISEKKGFLYKQSSKSDRTPSILMQKLGQSANPSRKNSGKRTGWVKRWISFDAQHFKYFANQKSVVSKRIIPVSTIVNVEQEIKQGENHPYRFILTTVDRNYCFATEDATQLSLWTNVIMHAVLDCNANSEVGDIPEGGDMHCPNLKGYVKMEGVAGKRFMAVKGEKMCYYNAYNDYVVGSPIHEIEMKLGSVKEGVGKLKLQLITPYASYVLQYENETDMSQWKEALEEAIAEGLSDDSVLELVTENHSNRFCADCGAPNPHWASINLAITICKHCAGIHRLISIPLSKVKSLRMDFKVWTPCTINLMKEIGNDNANNFWEWNATDDDKIDSEADMPTRQEYIMSKYKQGAFCRWHPLVKDVEALNEALCKAVQYNNVLETMQLLHSGAQMHYVSKTYGTKGSTPLQLARSAAQKLQEEFLLQNGADNLPPQPSASARINSVAPNTSMVPQIPPLSFICRKGYLYKTGSDIRSAFLKRWVDLDNTRLSYYETEKSPVAKDSVDCNDMLSVTKTSDERYPHAFEIASIRQNNRVYLFASDAPFPQERDDWVTMLCQAICALDPDKLYQIRGPVDRGGVVHLRVGATGGEYRKTWIHLAGHTLHIQNTAKDDFEQVDLRMIKTITMLQSSESCNNALEKEGHPFVIDLVDTSYYIQADLKKETTAWYTAILMATRGGRSSVEDQQLTSENVPVLVEKCIDFLSLHALDEEGIYRHNGQHSRVSQLLNSFLEDARSVHLVKGETQIHDVTNTLKRFFRSLEDPLLRTCLYPKWLDFAGMKYSQTKVRWYKQLLTELPTVNYATLKAMIRHLAMVVDHSAQNKMGIANLASIFGPVFMTVDKTDSSGGFTKTGMEIAVVSDLIEHVVELFEIQEKEIERDIKIREAMEKITRLQASDNASTSNVSEELLVGIHVDNKYSDTINVKVAPGLTVGQLMQDPKVKQRLQGTTNHGLYEVICQEDLERPLHYGERVWKVVRRWGSWPDEFRQDCYLCFKDNYVAENIQNIYDASLSLFGEMKFSEKKGFKKFCFEFSQLKLSYQRDPKSSHLGSWNVEDITVYLGSQQKKTAPTEYLLTFVKNDEKIVKNRDTPYFGHTICCANKEELYRWLAAIIIGQHPKGLNVDDDSGASNNLDTVVPTSPNPLQSPHSAITPHKPSLWSRVRNLNK